MKTELTKTAASHQSGAALHAEAALRRDERWVAGEAVAPVVEREVPNAFDGIEAAFSRILAGVRKLTPEQAKRSRFESMIAPRMGAIGFPARYRVDVGAWNCAPQEATFQFCRGKFTEVGSIIALVGERGVGKTFIAAQLCRERIDLWLSYYERQPADRPAKAPLRMGRYAKLTDLIATYKPLYADFGSIETEKLMLQREELCRESLLCIDELHECEDQRLKMRVLTDILDRRYSNRLDTLLISNETEQAFRQSIGDSALSRITEHGEIVTCAWESWRR
jgi:DNA replication protein DnaC